MRFPRGSCLGRWLKGQRSFCSIVGDLTTYRELSPEMKHQMEQKWHNKLGDYRFDPFDTTKPKRYVLAMFPYPSGNLHMGHVRVYTISDAMARFYRLKGANVLHPMGWDAFGLPAENAAIQRRIPADTWTHRNIGEMRKQLEMLAFSFDWEREFATCEPEYYRWTQQLFLMLVKDGLAYQREALVNWDPVDETVLADEQVDDNGCSWRSGAKVEKKVLRQWFVRTTAFAKQLLEGLSDPELEDWKDIIKLQRHWIGECEGYSFEFPLVGDHKMKSVPVWTRDPVELKKALFIAIHPTNLLNDAKKNECLLESVIVKNPFTEEMLPVIVTEAVPFPEGCDTYLAVDSEQNRKLAVKSGLNLDLAPNRDEEKETAVKEILEQGIGQGIGGHPVSSKLRDWLISRQRFWGTPIPIIHCPSCGTVPVPEQDLPVQLPTDSVGVPLAQNEQWLRVNCPSCQRTDCRRESDTMDTFVDSSWYFLRFIDAHNKKQMFDRTLAHRLMPVDLYVGGKEHAVLHLYYARFVAHYLHSKGLLPTPEPFKRLLVQGMVMGRSYRVVNNGKYIPAEEVEVLDEKHSKAIERATGEPVTMLWEKMSKSKLNGVDPLEVLREHGCDTLRLILLADVAPTSHRNWSEATFPGILNWQKRLWMTMHDFRELRAKVNPESAEPPATEEFTEQEHKLWDARNYFTAGATFNYRHSHQLSVGISKMQGLTNAIRRAPPDVVTFGRQYERALAAQIVMLAPMAPHFAAELWHQLVTAPHRVEERDASSGCVLQWDGTVFDQRWPEIDEDFPLDLTFKINGAECCILKIPAKRFNQLTHQESLDLALRQEPIVKLIGNRPLRTSDFVLYPSCEAALNVDLDRAILAEGQDDQDATKSKKEKKDKKLKKKKSLQVLHIG
ncbi:leucine--tRNA ligase, mitochondrial [Anopheles marshallii]|uniref:leucine--tRNA ligase, mitochondrial n=1 Tax=Anopheles marshallii TaxID=1521116 RepID=UPI00237BEF16|nr:leucine--tRNA ligase, mitochondrial [Anopheles marshallii]